MREDGYVSIVGRVKDVVIRGGENIAPREIEELLHTHPKIREAYVVGVPDAVYGEEVCAWVSLRDGEQGSAEELRNFCRGRLASHKIPRYVYFAEQFPATASGKVQKFKLRELAIERTAVHT
jgi:fatty-acyl-CoA synthase